MAQTKRKPSVFFRGIHGAKLYPAWRYHKIKEPILVNDTKEDLAAKEKGFDHVSLSLTHSPYIMNHMLDFEEMSSRQLALYIREEFGVDLPHEIGQIKLMKIIWKLTVNSPTNKDRVVLLAQSVKMDYDETVLEIRRLMDDPDIEKIKEVIYA